MSREPRIGACGRGDGPEAMALHETPPHTLHSLREERRIWGQVLRKACPVLEQLCVQGCSCKKPLPEAILVQAPVPPPCLLPQLIQIVPIQPCHTLPILLRNISQLPGVEKTTCRLLTLRSGIM